MSGMEEEILNQEQFISVTSPDHCVTFLKSAKSVTCPYCATSDEFSFRNISVKRCRYPGREKSKYLFEEYELRCDACGKLWTQLFRIEKDSPSYKKWMLLKHIGTLQHWEEIQQKFPIWTTPSLLVPQEGHQPHPSHPGETDEDEYTSFLTPQMKTGIPSELYAFVKQEETKEAIFERMQQKYLESKIILKEVKSHPVVFAPIQPCNQGRIKWEMHLVLEIPLSIPASNSSADKPKEDHKEGEKKTDDKHVQQFFIKLFAIQRNISEFALNVGRSVDLIQQALDCPYTLGVSCFLHSQLDRLQWQWRALLYAAPEAAAVLDWSQRRVFSLGWLRVTAIPRLSPLLPFDDIFQIVVQPDSTSQKAWLHTFGLNRFNIPELEVLDVPTDMETLTNYHSLLSTIVGIFLMQVPKENEFFLQFTDDVKVKWVRCQKLNQLNSVIGNSFGTQKSDRQLHHPYFFSAVLFSSVNSKDISLGYYSKELVASELFISNSKIDKYVATISQARAVLFDLMWDKLQGQSCVCLVKIGFPVQDPAAPIVSEFMWCEVKALRGVHLQVKLMNQPVHVKNLKKDDILTVAWRQLQTWNIVGKSLNVEPNNTEVIANMLSLNRLSDSQYQQLIKNFS